MFHPVGTGRRRSRWCSRAGSRRPTSRPSFTATVTASGIIVNDVVNLGKDLQRNVGWSLQVPATAVGGLDVTLTSSDASEAAAVVEPDGCGQRHRQRGRARGAEPERGGGLSCRALASSGSVQITASASGYANGSGQRGLRAVGVVNSYPGAISRPRRWHPIRCCAYARHRSTSGDVELLHGRTQLRAAAPRWARW